MSENEYDPPRGCGRKRPGFYLSNEGDSSPYGLLAKWTHFYGDHLPAGFDGFEPGWNVDCSSLSNIGQAVINPTYSIIAGEIMPAMNPPANTGESELYMDLVGRIGAPRFVGDGTVFRSVKKPVAIIDYVGEASYTAASFRREVDEYGVSRRTSASTAKKIVEMIGSGAVPIIFATNQPEFKSEHAREEALRLASAIVEYPDDYMRPVWTMDNWGVFANNQSGADHFMTTINSAYDKVHNLAEEAMNQGEFEFASFMADRRAVRWVKRPFGCSWITRVLYVPEKDESVEQKRDMSVAGFDVIDIFGEENDDE